MDNTLVGVSLVVFGAFLVAMAGFALVTSVRSRDWPVVSGEIISVQVVAVGDAIYAPEIRYRYHVHGKTYTSFLITPMGKIAIGHREAERIARSYALSRQVAVRYNPGNPQYALLETDVPVYGVVLMIGVGAASLAIGLIGFLPWASH